MTILYIDLKYASGTNLYDKRDMKSKESNRIKIQPTGSLNVEQLKHQTQQPDG